MKIDLDGDIVWKPDTDYGINKSGYVIHGAIHRARADVACVIHTHTRAGMAVSCMKCGLLPLTRPRSASSATSATTTTKARRPTWTSASAWCAISAPHDAMVLRIHGLLTCGATIPQAFNTMYQLELSCRAQVDAMAARTD